MKKQIEQISPRHEKQMQVANSIAAIYHLDLRMVSSPSSSDFSTYPAIISPIMQQFNTLFQKP